MLVFVMRRDAVDLADSDAPLGAALSPKTQWLITTSASPLVAMPPPSPLLTRNVVCDHSGVPRGQQQVVPEHGSGSGSPGVPHTPPWSQRGMCALRSSTNSGKIGPTTPLCTRILLRPAGKSEVRLSDILALTPLGSTP